MLKSLNYNLKILIANHRYFISGGPERYMFNLKNVLSSRGHEVIPFSIHYTKNRTTPYSKYFVEPLGTRDEVTFKEQKLDLKTLLRTVSRLFYAHDVKQAITRLILEKKPQVAFILHYLRKFSPSLLVGLKEAGIPIVVRLSDFAMLCPQEHCLRDDLPCKLCVTGNLWPSIFYRCVQNSFVASTLNVLATYFHQFRHYFDLVDVFVTTNYFAYEMMVNIGFAKNRLRCIPTFTDIEFFKPNNTFTKKNHILYVGRLEYVKGVHILIDALRSLNRKRPDINIKATILGIGNEKYYNLLRSNIKNAGIENAIKLIGEVNSSDVAELLSKSFLSIIPSLWYESLPNSILESYSCGTPVLASDIGSLRECVTHGETGYLFYPGNSESLAMWLEYCFDHPEKTNKMGQNARLVAEKKYASERHIVKLENLFAEVIG